MSDPILKLVQTTQELWNEKKGLSYSTQHSTYGWRKGVLKKIYKYIKEIRELKLEQEIEVLCDLYGVKKEDVIK